VANDNGKTKAELVAELAELRQQRVELEGPGVGLRLFRDLMDQSGNVLAIVEPRLGRLLDANKRMSELLGYSHAELLAMVVTDFDTNLSDKAAWETFVEKLRLRGSMDLESVLKRKDGTKLPVEVNVRHTVDNHKEFLVVIARDITERKQNEAELLRSREMAHTLLNATHDLVMMIDPDGLLMDLNEAAARSIRKGRDQLIGTNIFSHFPPEVAQCRRAQLRECVATGRVMQTLDERDGKAFDTSTYPILDNEGSVKLLAVFASDITAQRSAQEDLKSERVFIEAALNASPDTFFVFDVGRGKPVRWNREFREVSGYSDAEIAGMTAPDDFYETEDLEIAHGALSELAETGYARVDLPLLTKEGKKIPYEYAVTMIVLTDGATSLACSVGRDITDRKQAEEALLHSEEKHRSFLDSLSAGVVAHAPDTSTLYWNRMSLKLLGLSADQMLGRTAFDPQWNFLHEDGSVMAVEDYPVNLTLKNQSDLSGYVVGVVRPVTNDVIWTFCNSHRILKENGELEHILVSFQDITDLKKAGEERSSLQAQVQHAQKLESLGVLAGGIAHDFNNLLMTILGNTDLALQDLSPVSPVRPNIQEVDSAARRAAELAKQMLAYSGQGHFVVAPLDLSEMVDEMAHLLESSISKKVSMKADLNPSLPAINADAAQIQQVIMNLITNASEAIPEDEPGVISVSTNIQECSRDYLAGSYLDEKQSPGIYVFLEVKDTGCGMNEKTQASLFDPFFTTKFTGRGLGLAAVLGIARGHNGAIMVDSELGKGTTFRVLFPGLAKDAKVHTPTGDLTKRDEWRGTGTVLVVDDEGPVRRLVTTMVERLGFETLAAADGQEAVEVFREHADSITCVLLDLTMPRMDGGEACLEIQRSRRDVPIVLSSGYEETELFERFDGYEMAGFIQKPYKLAKLREILQSVHAVEP
jgi:two-component system cell cycle sensor histidine kinase/response regulator CckA